MLETRPGASELLSSVFGFDGFRPGQAEVVGAVAAGRNVLAIMPTGGGKSLCFQLPALLRTGVTVVISPLIALMREQVRALTEAGVAAGALTSGNTPEETDAVWAALEEGRLKLLYMAPERLASSGTGAASSARPEGKAADPEAVAPDFSVLVYPSNRNRADLEVSELTPPAFIVHAYDDPAVPPGQAVASPSSPWMRPTASASGATISGRTTCASGRCAGP